MSQNAFDPYAGLTYDEVDETKDTSSNTAFDPYAGLTYDEEVEESTTSTKSFDPFAGLTYEDTPKAKTYSEQEYDLSVPKSFEDFSQDQGYIDSIEEYAISRYGEEEGGRMEGESNEDYLNRFMFHVRMFENNSVELAAQYDWIRGASEEDKANFGYVYSQLERMPAFFEEGGGSFGRGLRDYAFSIASDPLNLIGFGAAKIGGAAAQRGIIEAFKTQGKKAAMAQAKKIAIREGALPIGIGTGLEVAGETTAAYGTQLLQAEAGMITEDNISLLEAGVIGGLTGVLGVGGGILSQRDIAKRTKKLIEDDEEFFKKLTDSVAESTAAVTDELADEGFKFNPIQGYQILRPLTEVMEESGLMGAAVSDARLSKEVAKRVTKAATEIVKDMAEEGDPRLLQSIADKTKKASDIAYEIINREDIDSDIISGALARAGMTPEQFADVAGVSLSKSASELSAYSDLGKLLKRMRELDPELQKKYKELFRADDSTTMLGKAHDFMMRLDRERRALMVTQIATTARNVATAGMRLSFDMASNFIESSMYHVGRVGNAASDSAARTTGHRNGLQNVARDTFGILGRIIDQGGSKAATDVLLKYNPRLARTLDRSLQEAGPDDLSKFSLFFNKLNMAQDVMFRRAVFADAVDKRLRRISGETMDLEKFVASGKALPNDILQDSVEEALAFTFARMPKPGGKKVGDTIGYHFIKVNEAIGPLPVGLGTGTFPFSRFMVNAMQFQFDYSPLNAVNAIYHGAKGMHMKAIKGVSDAKTDAQMMKAREAMAKSIVGTAALTSAIYYRANNQDKKWYDITSDDGKTVDARPFFPIAPYLAVADLIVKVANDDLNPPTLKMVMEGITGAQLRTGASSYVVDTFFNELQSEGNLSDIGTQRMGEIVGGYMGELVGGAMAPARVVNDVVAQFDAESAKVRDSSQATGLTFTERATSSFLNKTVKNIPVLQKTLPEFESPTREGAIIRQSPLVGQLTGVRTEAPRSDVETELISQGYENFQIVPSTGDKQADRYIKKHMGILVETMLAREIEMSSYQNLSATERKASMKAKLRRYRKLAKELGRVEALREGDKGYSPFDRAEWARGVSKTQRGLADEYYKDRYGKTVMEMQAEEPNVNHIKIGTIVARALSKQFK